MNDSANPRTASPLDAMEVSPTAPDTTDVAQSEDHDALNTTPVPTPSPIQQSGAVVGALETEDNRDTEFVYVLRRYNTIPDSKIYSPWHFFGGFRWRLLIFPRGNQTSSHDLSVYLECGGPVSRAAGGNDMSEYAGVGNGKEIAVGGVANIHWNRPAKFSLHLVHPMSPIGRANLKDETENDNALSDVDVTDSGLGVTGIGAGVHTPRGEIVKETSHTFRETASDWGFLEFASFTLLQPMQYADDNMNVVIMVRIRLQDNLNDAMFNNAVTWDSRKETGFVGFKNQGATCYMNSLLQSLYMVSAFRKAVYNMPLPEPGNENSGSELSYALQKVFYELQFSPTVVKTKKLTESFGWDTTDAFTQHDVQELKLILCDELAEKMKKIAPDQPNTLSTLFQGKLLNYIECVNVDYKSTREEHFSDLSLNVKGCRNIYESFDKYIEVEMMEGDNKYRADGYEELQDAKKGVKFLSLPPVLQLHLKRFEYDFSRNAMVKINDRYEFETELDLNQYVEDSNGTNIYVLHSVLVHIGDVNGGHYHVFIRPDIDISDTEPKKINHWFKFDDETVSQASEEAAVIDNFGVGGEKEFGKRVSGMDDDLGNGGLNGQIPPPNVFQTRNRNYQTRRFSNAYMLQYLRKSGVPYLLKSQDESDVPRELAARIKKEREEEEQKKRERTDQHLYMDIAVAVSENMVEHHGSDLVQWDKVRQLHVRRAMLLSELKIRLQKEGIVKDARFMRLWKCSGRRNDSIRPDSLVANGIDSQPISDSKLRDSLTQPGYHMPLYSGRLSYFGQENIVRMYAEDFCSPYCLGSGDAYRQFVRRETQLNGDHRRIDNIGLADGQQNISEMETDTVKMYASPQFPMFQLVSGKEVLLFVKFYTSTPCPRLQWLGEVVVDRGMTVNELHPVLRSALDSYCKRDPLLLGLDEGTDIIVFEEISPTSVTQLDGTKTLEAHRIPYESDSGDILLFQRNIFSLGKSNRNNLRLMGTELSDSSYGEEFEWDGMQEQSRGDGTDLPLGGRPMPAVSQYFEYLASRIKIEFKDKATIGGPDEGKSIFFEMLRKDTYSIARRVLAGALGPSTHPDYLRLFAHDQTRETATNEPLRLRDTDELQRVFPMHSMVTPCQPEYGILWYERTEYHISEFDQKDEVRVVWRQDGGTHATPYSLVSTLNDVRTTQASYRNIIRADLSVSVAGNENEDKMLNSNETSNGQIWPAVGNSTANEACRSFSVLVPSNSKYANVMDQVRIKLRISADVGIRMFEVKNSKILRSICPDDPVPPLMMSSQDYGAELRAEPIPENETEEALGNEYELMTVVHLAKDQQRAWRGATCFGVPFVIKVKKDGETIRIIRERIREKLGVPEEEFEQWPLAEIVQLKIVYLRPMDVLYTPHPRSSLEFCTLAIEHKSTAPAKKTSLAISRCADKPLKIRS